LAASRRAAGDQISSGVKLRRFSIAARLEIGEPRFRLGRGKVCSLAEADADGPSPRRQWIDMFYLPTNRGTTNAANESSVPQIIMRLANPDRNELSGCFPLNWRPLNSACI
jgi:hypothetical protein